MIDQKRCWIYKKILQCFWRKQNVFGSTVIPRSQCHRQPQPTNREWIMKLLRTRVLVRAPPPAAEQSVFLNREVKARWLGRSVIPQLFASDAVQTTRQRGAGTCKRLSHQCIPDCHIKRRRWRPLTAFIDNCVDDIDRPALRTVLTSAQSPLARCWCI